MTPLGNRVLADVISQIKMRSYWSGWTLIHHGTGVLIKRGDLDTDTHPGRRPHKDRRGGGEEASQGHRDCQQPLGEPRRTSPEIQDLGLQPPEKRGNKCLLRGPLCVVLGRVAQQTNTAACLDRNQAGRFQPALPLPLSPQNGGCHALIGRLGAGQNPH